MFFIDFFLDFPWVWGVFFQTLERQFSRTAVEFPIRYDQRC